MKKALLTLTLIVAVSSFAMAQPRTIGARLGIAEEFSYQHGIGYDCMFDISAGVENVWSQYRSATATIMFDWIFNWGGNFSLYLGPGLGATYGFGTYWDDVEPDSPILDITQKKKFGLLFGAQVGVEYAFDIPLTLSLDVRPMGNLLSFSSFRDNPSYIVARLVNVGIGIRYRFD